MQRALIDRIAAWIASDPDNILGLRSLKAKIDFLSEVLFHEYRPELAGQHGDFPFRLAKWLECAPDDAQKKLMYRLLQYLFFVGSKECDSMYLTAYSRHIAQWVMVSERINLSRAGAEQLLRRKVSETLMTAITDSFNLADFLRVNLIQGVNTRFVWKQSLETNWDPVNFEQTVLRQKTRIVLLEDFVGSGEQMEDAVHACCQLPSAPPVLLCPLIVCPDGAQRARLLTARYPHLTCSPVLELNPCDFVTPAAGPNEPPLFSEIRQLVRDVHPLVRGGGIWPQDWGPFGFESTGAVVVKHDNCPDNTLPLLHHESDSPWNPLFRRVSRLP